jgi:hypothetical protein
MRNVMGECVQLPGRPRFVGGIQRFPQFGELDMDVEIGNSDQREEGMAIGSRFQD